MINEHVINNKVDPTSFMCCKRYVPEISGARVDFCAPANGGSPLKSAYIKFC